MTQNEYLSYLKKPYSLYEASKLLKNIRSRTSSIEFPSLKLALLGSTTLDFMKVPVELCGALNGISITASCLPSEQIAQQCLNSESDLYGLEPDLISILTRLEDMSPVSFECFTSRTEKEYNYIKDDVIAQIYSWLTSIRKFTDAAIILHTFSLPEWDVDQVNEVSNDYSNWMLTLDLNRELSIASQKFKGVYVVNTDRAARRTRYEDWHSEKLWKLARVTFGANDPKWLINLWLPIFNQLVGLQKKCLILDLDNTLWGGVVGEEGVHSLKIGMDFPGNVYLEVQNQVKQLSGTGVMLALASKNNESDAKEVFQSNPHMLLKWDDFLVKKVNWNNKADNIREIATELNIGLSHIVFIDDNPSECELIKKELPSVSVIQVPTEDISLYPDILRTVKFFEGSRLTEEDISRVRMYKSNFKRDNELSKASNLNEFLTSLQMTASVNPISESNLARVSQMFSKTNQFNATTIRYSESQLDSISKSKSWLTFTAELSDKFGKNGLVIVAMIKLEGNAAYIDSLLMSCRVISRTLEGAFLNYIKDFLVNKTDMSVLKAKYVPTKKNVLIERLFDEHGFSLESDVGVKYYNLNLREDLNYSNTFVEIN